MVDGELDGFGDSVGDVETLTRDELDNALRNPDDRRLLYLAAALRRGMLFVACVVSFAHHLQGTLWNVFMS